MWVDSISLLPNREITVRCFLISYTYINVEIKYRDCNISITNIVLNSESMEWHCDICLTMQQGNDTVDMKNTYTFAVNSEEEAMVTAVALAKELIDSNHLGK